MEHSADNLQFSLIDEKFAELNAIFEEFYNRRHPMVMLRDSLSGVLDVLEARYEQSWGVPGYGADAHAENYPKIDDRTEENRYRCLCEELRELVRAKDEAHYRVHVTRLPAPGDYAFLKWVGPQITEIRTELEPLVRPRLFPLTQTEDNP